MCLMITASLACVATATDSTFLFMMRAWFRYAGLLLLLSAEPRRVLYVHVRNVYVLFQATTVPFIPNEILFGCETTGEE